MSILFLDVDGVLNRAGFKPRHSSDLPLADWIEPPLASNLQRVLETTAAMVVFSSSWRNRSESEVIASFQFHGIALPLIGYTPRLEGEPRWREIEEYLNATPIVPRYAIVDDEWGMGPLSGSHVRVSPINGLDEATAELVIRALSRNAAGA
jgi:HAD domain in Swiss Army Knife RNA repair proteins